MKQKKIPPYDLLALEQLAARDLPQLSVSWAAAALKEPGRAVRVCTEEAWQESLLPNRCRSTAAAVKGGDQPLALGVNRRDVMM